MLRFLVKGLSTSTITIVGFELGKTAGIALLYAAGIGLAVGTIAFLLLFWRDIRKDFRGDSA